MSSVASKMPADTLRAIFSFTPNLILRGDNQIVEIKKLAKERYVPLKRIYRTKLNVFVYEFLLGFKMVSLHTEKGRPFYHFECGRDVFTASVVPSTPDADGVVYSEVVYAR